MLKRDVSPGDMIGDWKIIAGDPDFDGFWICRCKCGKLVSQHLSTIESSKLVFRKCRHKKPKSRRDKHNMRGSPEYVAWNNMKALCGNPNNPRYRHYGGKGIKVCERWLESFENFYADMEPRPLGHALSRKDKSGDFSPENTEWSKGVRRRKSEEVQFAPPASTEGLPLFLKNSIE